MACQVTIYLNESDEYQRRPLHLQLLKFLREQNVLAASCFHAVAGFNGRMRVKTASLVDAGGKLPIVVMFVDQDEHVDRILPHLKEMAANRIIVRESVEFVQTVQE